MTRTFPFGLLRSRWIVALFGSVLLAASAGWQFVPGAQPQRRPQPSLQQQIDALPAQRGGVIRLAGNVVTDRPIRLWNHVTLDLNGYELRYTGPARDRDGQPLAAVMFADRLRIGERHGGGVKNGWITGNARAIDREAGEWNLLNVRIGPNLTVGVELDAIDLTRAGWTHRIIIDDVWVWHPGGRAVHLNANVATVRNVTVKNGPRRPGDVPDAFVKVCGISGGGGIVENLWVEAYNAQNQESVTQLAVTGGTWTAIQGHLEQPGPAPSVVVSGRDTSLTFVNQGIYKPVPVRATGGARLMFLSPNAFLDDRLLHDAGSEIIVNGAKRGAVVAPMPSK